MSNNSKKYVSLTRLSSFLDNIKAKYSQIGHKHTIAELTDYKVDTSLSSTSTNPVQNKVLDAEFDAIGEAMGALELAIDGKSDSSHNHDSAYDTKGAAANSLASANAYTDENIASLNDGFSEVIYQMYGNDITEDGAPTIRAIANDEANTALESAKDYTDDAVAGKANASHNHDDRYYTETEIDTKLASKSDSTHNHDSSYDAKGSASAVQENLNTVSDTLDAHTEDTGIHVTTANKSNWNAAYTHSQAAHARTDATKVADSTTNGNILINGTETNVYSHPNSGATAGTYKSVTVNAQGHVTAGSNPTTLAGYGITDAESKGAANTALVSAKEYTDTVAEGKADKSQGIFYIEGDGTTDTTNKVATWTGSHDDISEYYAGLMIAYKIGTAGSTTTTLNINNLGAVAVVKNATSAISTSFAVNSVILLVYTVDGTTAYWKAHDYDANTRNTVGDYRKNGTKLYFVGTTSSDASSSSSYATSYTNNNIYVNTSDVLYSAKGFSGNLTGNADTATSATSATKATQDASGNVITSTYETKTDASSKLAEAKTYADTAASTVKNDLLNGAGAAYDTLKELGDLIDTNVDAIDALEAVAAGKADKTHSHAIADVSGLQSALDDKAASGHTHDFPVDSVNGKTGAVELTASDVGAATTSHSHKIENMTNFSTRVWDKTDEFASNTFLAAPTSGSGTASFRKINSSDLPTVPVTKGGTGATTAAGVLTNLGITATATELNYVDGVTSNIQTQLNGKAASSHSHSYLPLSGGTLTNSLGIAMNDVSFSVGNLNASFTHYNTSGTSGHWFNKDLYVAGNIYGGSSYNQLVLTTGNIGDYVSAQGTSGIWTYRKWANGIAECWTNSTSADIYVNNAWGSVYYGYAVLSKAYPFTFTTKPIVTAAPISTKSDFWLAASSSYPGSVSASPAFYAISATSNTATTAVINMYVVGRWK